MKFSREIELVLRNYWYCASGHVTGAGVDGERGVERISLGLACGNVAAKECRGERADRPVGLPPDSSLMSRCFR